MVRVLVGCYRTGDAGDPAIYADAVMACLSSYPPEVVERVVDPRVGLPSKCKWLPTVAEVKEACEAEMAPIRKAQEWERAEARRRAQIEETEAWNRSRAQPVSAKRYSYTEFLDMAAKGEVPGRPVGRFEQAPPKAASDDRERKPAPSAEYQSYANWTVFQRECAAAGVDPASGVSPSLRKLLALPREREQGIEG